MAITKSSRTQVAASTTCSAGGTVNGSAWATINYGVSGLARIINGGTAPTTPCGFYLDFSPDGGTTTFTGPMVGVGDLVASSTTIVPYAIAIGGGGDWTHYRVRFTGNTGQAVTVQANDSTTTGI